MSTSGRLAKHKGAKIPDYELNITITAPSLLTSYFINLNWNWMKKIPYWIFFKFALRGKRVGVVFFQLRMRETDANREYFTPWLTTKLPNDPPSLRNCFSGQTRDWVWCHFWVARDILWPQRKHEIHKINNNWYKCSMFTTPYSSFSPCWLWRVTWGQTRVWWWRRTWGSSSLAPSLQGLILAVRIGMA